MLGIPQGDLRTFKAISRHCSDWELGYSSGNSLDDINIPRCIGIVSQVKHLRGMFIGNILNIFSISLNSTRNVYVRIYIYM